MKVVPHQKRCDGTPTDTLPRVGQRVRSYRLHERTSICSRQEGLVTRYTGEPNAPYEVTELQCLGTSEKYIWPMKTHQVSAKALVNRLVQEDGLTTEERMIRDQRVLRTFDVEQNETRKMKKAKLLEQGDTRERLERKPLIGGVAEVWPHERGTMNKIIYEDMRTESLTTQQLLEQATFFDDPRRAQRLRELERQASMAASRPVRAATRRTARRSYERGTNRSFFTRANRDPCGNLSNTQHSEGFLPPTGWSWTRPGLYPDVAPLTPTPRTGSSVSPAGPGLPNGDATGDDD